jgi:Ca-activated chloride channel family protein
MFMGGSNFGGGNLGGGMFMGGGGNFGGGNFGGGFGGGNFGGGNFGGGFGGNFGGGFGGGNFGGGNMRVVDWAKTVQNKKGAISSNRGLVEDERLSGPFLEKAKELKVAYDQARAAFAKHQHQQTQVGQLGVDLSVQANALRNQTRLALTPLRRVAGRNVLEIGGAWIDEEFDPAMKTFVVKALSPAYFEMLEGRPQLRELFQLGNHLVWVTPNGVALVIDPDDGQEKLESGEIDKLFEPRPGS